jgi:hypothetical protein
MCLGTENVIKDTKQRFENNTIDSVLQTVDDY